MAWPAALEVYFPLRSQIPAFAPPGDINGTPPWLATVEFEWCNSLCCNGFLRRFHLCQLAQVDQVRWRCPSPSSAQTQINKDDVKTGVRKTRLRAFGSSLRSRRFPGLFHQPAFRHQLSFLASYALILSPLYLTDAANVDVADFARMVRI